MLVFICDSSMGLCCSKPSVYKCEKSRKENESSPEFIEAQNRAAIILHAYHDLPDTQQGTFSRKRRGSFVFIEYTSPNKKIRTNDMIACLENYLDEHSKN